MPGALRLAGLTSYLFLAAKGPGTLGFVYFGFQLFLPSCESIRGHALFPLYPLHERHHLRGRGEKLKAIDPLFEYRPHTDTLL